MSEAYKPKPNIVLAQFKFNSFVQQILYFKFIKLNNKLSSYFKLKGSWKP